MQKLLLPLSLSALLAACGGSASSPVPHVAQNSPAVVASATPAASAAPSTPSPTAVYVALGDSITALGSPTPYAALLNPNVIDLAISGETAVGAVTDELPQVPANATLVTVFLGENDLSHVWESGETVAQYASAMQAIVAGVKQRAPRAMILVLNLPNYPWQQGGMVPYNAVIAALGVTVVDTYDDATYLTELQTTPVGNIHPTDAGNRELASLVQSMI